MRPIIRVQNVSKRYRIGAQDAAYGTLRDTIAASLRSPLGRLRGRAAGGESIWALKDVGFDVRPGEVLGLIGHNGAGKSTLLKILSRITEPTEGTVELYGRIGSLLEVGTGFHPELTGRENVYLNGAILGMSRREIDRKFGEVVEFSGVGKFLDTPVKRYSSGMYVRLAFSVAAHMEPDILLVDEVLAVGDISFQQKCLDHMRRLKASGMTILLVSHNLAAIQSTCERALYLEGGQVVAFGETLEVIRQYRERARRGELEAAAPSDRTGGEAEGSGVRILGFEMFGPDGRDARAFRFDDPLRIRIRLEAARRVEAPLINFGVRRADGVIVCNFNNWYDNFKIDHIEGECVLEGWLPPLRLIPHYYEIHVLVWQRLAGHSQGDLAGLQPLAVRTFGDFQIEGPALTDQDGVFQRPAARWALTMGGARVEHTEIDDNSLAAAFSWEGRPEGVAR